MARWSCALVALALIAALATVPHELVRHTAGFMAEVDRMSSNEGPPSRGGIAAAPATLDVPVEADGRAVVTPRPAAAVDPTPDPPTASIASDQDLPYCQIPSANRRLFGCADEDAFQRQRVLATGFHKTVWLVSVNGSSYVLKTSNRTGARARKHNEAMDPRASRQGHIRHEYRVARSVAGRHGLLPYSGYCSHTATGVAWSLWPFLSRGTFPVSGAQL
eukprot:EG_transcript_27738